jgi:4-amino-4-deoxy-L-arabinose transferase-like glycosyltransferase
MNNRLIFKILVLAFVCRGLYFIGVSKTNLFKTPDKSISVVYQREAYLYAWGYGFSQTIPGSAAYKDVEMKRDSVNMGEALTHPLISSNGLYPTSHYPPGWAVTGAFLYNMLQVPIVDLMTILSILFDLVALYFFIRLLSFFFPSKFVFWCAILYSLFPPLLFLQTIGAADSLMQGFIILISYFFFYSEKSAKRNKFLYWALIGILTGISALFRSDYFLFSFFLSLLPWLKQKQIIYFLKYNFTVGIIAVIILLPWALRNKNLYGRLNFTSTSLGGTLVTGLATFQNPWKLGPSDFDRGNEALQAGINTPFEENGNEFFLSKYKMYVKENPGYFWKAVLYRTLYFVLAPYDWGIAKDKKFSFTEIRNKGNIISRFGLIVKEKFFNFLSVAFSLISFISLLMLLIKPVKIKEFRNFAVLTVGYVYLSHVFIHMTANYTLPIICIQIPLFVLGVLFIFSKRKYERIIYQNFYDQPA